MSNREQNLSDLKKTGNGNSVINNHENAKNASRDSVTSSTKCSTNVNSQKKCK